MALKTISEEIDFYCGLRPLERSAVRYTVDEFSKRGFSLYAVSPMESRSYKSIKLVAVPQVNDETGRVLCDFLDAYLKTMPIADPNGCRVPILVSLKGDDPNKTIGIKTVELLPRSISIDGVEHMYSWVRRFL